MKPKYIRFYGFTLVELTAAIALLTIMLLGGSQYIFHSRRQLAEANLKHDAWIAMSDRMEYALALDYDAVLDSTLLDDLLVEQATPLKINGKNGFRTTEVEILYTSGTFNGDGVIGSDENACMYCGDLNRPAILSMTYTGDDCSLTHSSQSSGMVTCSGDPQFTSPVEIIASNSSNPADPNANIWFDGYVAIDSSFNINAYNAIQDHLDLDTYVHILDVSTGSTLQTIKFHTSCSEPLYQNDQFGSTVLTRFISELGVDVCGIGNNGDDVTISSNPGGGAGGAGLSYGHFDLDTTDGANISFFEIGNGKTDQHTHQYDDKYNVVGIDFFNLQNTHVNLLDAFDQTAKFKIIILNSHMSEGGRLVINGVYNPVDPSTYQSVVDYAEAYTNAAESIGSPPPDAVTGYTDFSALPVYSLDGEPGTTQLTNIGLYFNVDAIANAQPGGPFNLHPTNTGDTRKNTLGPNGEWRNGALTVWAVEVNPDGTDNFQIDMSSGHPHIVSGLLWEGYLFWHWEGPSFHEPGWITFDPGDPGVANQDEGGSGDSNPNGKVAICHIPPGNPQNQHTIMVSPNAVDAHLGHGCVLGACASESCGFCDDEHTKPARLTLRYTGDYCEASHHAQEDKKVSCTDYAAFESPVHIIATDKKKPKDKKAKIWFDGIVDLNGTFEIDAANAGENKLNSGTYVYIYDAADETLLQGIGFHTSCSQPLYRGDQFGCLLLEDLVDSCGDIVCENTGGSGIGNSGGGGVDDCGFCDTGTPPQMLFMTYSGEDCSASVHSLPNDKWSCQGDPMLTNPVFILATDKGDPFDDRAIIWFQGNVGLNRGFNINAMNAGRSHLKNDTFVHIFDFEGGTELQRVKFHTSCSQPLYDNDQFGAVSLNRFVDENGDEACADAQLDLGRQHADYLIKVTVKFAWKNPENLEDSLSVFISPQRSWKWN